MDIDFEEEENQSFSEDEDIGLQNQKHEPWQLGLLDLNERVLALHKNGDFTDITLTFPGTEVTYDAHRLILAISSPVFEGILYGPMRTEGRNVLLHGDDPVLMHHVIAHSYGYDLDIPDMNTALEVYKLADKYMFEGLKKECCKNIYNQMNSKNCGEILEFAIMFNFADLKSKFLYFIREMCEDSLNNYNVDEYREDEPENISAFEIFISLSDPSIECLLSEFVRSQVCVRNLDFQESWKYPQIPLEDNRIITIISSRGVCYLDKFYGCVDSECIQQFPLAPPVEISTNDFRNLVDGSHIPSVNEPDPWLAFKHHRYGQNTFEALELCLSVTDPHHAKRVIEAINQQNRFESNLIALHIRCEEVWPRNWSPIPPERTHRPSLLLISNADDDKTTWIVEAAKSFLPLCEGSYNKEFRQCNFDDMRVELDYVYEHMKPVNILFLPRSNFTPNGFINLMQELSTSGVKCKMIIFQSPNIKLAHKDRIDGYIHTLENREFNPRLEMVLEDCNMFRKVFEQIPKTYL